MLYDLFILPLTEPYFQKALIGGCIVAIVAGVVGCLVVLRRMAFLGDALSHAMIAGVAGGYLVMKLLFGLEAHAPGMLLGSLLAAIATVALISFVARISRVKEDTAIGIMYTGIFALGVVVVSIFRHYIHIDLMHFIMGDILGVADTDLWVSAFAGAFVLSLLILFFRHFQLATFDPVMAASIGLPVLLLDYLLTTCVSLVVVSAVSMVGVILVVGLLITPAATAYLLSDRLDRMMWLAALFGTTSIIGGLYLCVWLDSAGGGAIMLFCTLQFLVVLTVAPKYGLLARWLRLRSLIPQQVVEDILTTILRYDRPTPLSIIRTYVESGKGLQRALSRMVRDNLLEASEDGYRLTAAGRQEADKVLRAHRLWEAYLATIGTPAREVHSTAHQLEHLGGEAVEYLDEKLGQPKVGPHGNPIP
ncbi:iron chelate uptake ABC transporter family permease subunit [Desulfofustis glycolicus]|uniref:Manganese/iron transport system permease protein n=1 Tax=Desulfofustis glycolicus DSM 9705 TaxID=1121409 RepID=A0A1M5RVK4_9BACT|nr:iron chelate uptake ABC transporter family permease subunit [Desulfofustis glycolicus]MCB2216361.1 metal ABC transporter permease [Desulfobulbaceae bacterium]SHH30352.1 manganese/iron transport system permease protein [Desulfofustis glycolicus DSM 9705]